jgi:hypothetical protein
VDGSDRADFFADTGGFYNGEHGNTKPQWQADEQGMKVAADTRWAMGHLLPL